MIEYKVRVYGDRTEWFLNDKLHREDGPAIEYVDGEKYWYLNGKRHRIDGPAIEFANGHKEWYLNGKQVTKEEVINKSKKVYTTEELKNMTLEEIFNIVGKKS